jgi:hypothetical protein
MCTMMAGVMLVILGATGMGAAVKFIPRPVVIGFTNGIAVLIASTQIKDFFGLRSPRCPASSSAHGGAGGARGHGVGRRRRPPVGSARSPSSSCAEPLA